MSHTKNYLVILSFVLALVSCRNQKVKHKSSGENVAAITAEATTPNYNDAVNTTAFSDAYTGSITQTFIVKQNKITILTGKKGLKVTVNPSALETEDGQPVDGDIKVGMVELTSSEDLFRSNAATMSNGKLLVSGGSYFVGMECNGKKLKLKNNSTIQMEFPKIKDNEMELFYGDKDEEGSINWVKADEPLTGNSSIALRAIYNPPYPDNEQRKRFKSKFRLYKSLNDKVYYQKKLMTIEQMTNVLHHNGVDKNMDTLLIPAYDFYAGLSYNRNYKYDTIKRYRIVSCKDIDTELDSMEKEKKITALRDEVNRKYNEEWWKENNDGTLESNLQRYYAPSSVSG